MNTFFKFTKTFNPLKIATASLFGSYLGYNAYHKVFTRHEPPKEEYDSKLDQALHSKHASQDFLYPCQFFP